MEIRQFQAMGHNCIHNSCTFPPTSEPTPGLLAVAAQVEFERHILKPGLMFKGKGLKPATFQLWVRGSPRAPPHLAIHPASERKPMRARWRAVAATRCVSKKQRLGNGTQEITITHISVFRGLQPGATGRLFKLLVNWIQPVLSSSPPCPRRWG
jgi:hypothetical protein